MDSIPNFEMLPGGDGSNMIFVSIPRECPACHVMRGILINRDGRTRCWECDAALRARPVAASSCGLQAA